MSNFLIHIRVSALLVSIIGLTSHKSAVAAQDSLTAAFLLVLEREPSIEITPSNISAAMQENWPPRISAEIAKSIRNKNWKDVASKCELLSDRNAEDSGTRLPDPEEHKANRSCLANLLSALVWLNEGKEGEAQNFLRSAMYDMQSAKTDRDVHDRAKYKFYSDSQIDMWFLLGHMYSCLHHENESLDCFRHVTRSCRVKDVCIAAHMQIAINYMEKHEKFTDEEGRRDLNFAQADLLVAAKLDPDRVDLWKLLGDVDVRVYNFQNALNTFRKISESNAPASERAAVHRRIAAIYYVAKQDEASYRIARAELKRSIVLDPSENIQRLLAEVDSKLPQDSEPNPPDPPPPPVQPQQPKPDRPEIPAKANLPDILGIWADVIEPWTSSSDSTLRDKYVLLSCRNPYDIGRGEVGLIYRAVGNQWTVMGTLSYQGPFFAGSPESTGLALSGNVLPRAGDKILFPRTAGAGGSLPRSSNRNPRTLAISLASYPWSFAAMKSNGSNR